MFKKLFIIGLLVGLVGCDTPELKDRKEVTGKLELRVDQTLRAKIFAHCLDAIKLRDEASFAGMDSAILQCDVSATSMASLDSLGNIYSNGSFEYKVKLVPVNTTAQ